ncbi:Esterase SGNH hydrolase-type subgroup [Penicillium taxi]|uniref:Esterase SGNH hydrolase-type subgroup n=1 Tax=Penicillium taxi TaxID=168475 RepID=UPI002545BB37|nr:Esterase SGNH hydrolase-type subgroup [Penicillium taxi]KAJ5888665.1 Esterase SGNH hydrolase-type subgroup [Penicillium taxi]
MRTTLRTAEDMGKPLDQFILFGDSITQFSCNQDLGFAFNAQLQEAYSRKLDVINRGFSGYSTAHAIQVFPKFFPSPEIANVRFMTIFFGANDACVPGHEQHVSLEQFTANLKEIIQHPATRAQNPHIIILTPPPINEYQLEAFDDAKNTPHPSRTALLAKTYATAAKEVGALLDVAVADIWTAFMNKVSWKEGQLLVGSRDLPSNKELASLFTDGLHLTPAGYQIVYDEVMRTIGSKWPDQLPENIPMVFPAWDEAPK